jgi:hypothetical protein
MRQNKDITYSSILENLRTCKTSSSNFELFQKMVFENLKINVFEDPW